MAPVTRFAPSPTGLLHLGHAYSAWRSWEAARGGKWLLRIEDLDTERSKSPWEARLIEDLAWLGFRPSAPPIRQSARSDRYQAALDQLKAMNLLYPCFCTRREILAEAAAMASAPHGPDGVLYPGTCRSLDPALVQNWIEEGRPHTWRLRADQAGRRAGDCSFVDEEYGSFRGQPLLFGDPILARREMGWSYHLAVVVDDAEQGVTLVTRGCDLLPSTQLHVLLQKLLGLPTPRYCHYGLVVDGAGKRLAKRSDSESIASWRERGASPQEALAAARERARPCTESPEMHVPTH